MLFRNVEWRIFFEAAKGPSGSAALNFCHSGKGRENPNLQDFLCVLAAVPRVSFILHQLILCELNGKRSHT